MAGFIGRLVFRVVADILDSLPLRCAPAGNDKEFLHFDF